MGRMNLGSIFNQSIKGFTITTSIEPVGKISLLWQVWKIQHLHACGGAIKALSYLQNMITSGLIIVWDPHQFGTPEGSVVTPPPLPGPHWAGGCGYAKLLASAISVLLTLDNKD